MESKHNCSGRAFVCQRNDAGMETRVFKVLPNSEHIFQLRFANGTFNFTDPRHCSVNDPLMSTCFLNAANRDGFYESSPIVVRICLNNLLVFRELIRPRSTLRFGSYFLPSLRGLMGDYAKFAPHDTARLIELQGGNEDFVNRLNFIFDQAS